MLALPLTLFGQFEPAVSASSKTTRTMLDECCWIDHAPRFLDGADQLLLELDERVDWFRGRRLMYGTWHDEPRRTGTVAREGHSIPPAVDAIRTELSTRYDTTFRRLFCNYYETGQDSVAWHADRIGRTEVDPLVGIVSLGGPRDFRLRRKTGGDSHVLTLASGDLLVMGGSTQHHYEHSVPKTRSSPPRMSVTMRGSRGLSAGGVPDKP